MKKIISITLILAILLSCCFMLSGCADDPEKNFILSNKIKSDYIKQFDIEGVKTSEVLLEYYAGTYNGYTVAMLDASCHDFDEWQEEMSGTVINYPDTNRLLAYKGGKFITLTEAHASGALTDADIAEIANKFNAEITVFYQVCDEFDFEYVEPMDTPFNPVKYYVDNLLENDRFFSPYITIRMDEKFGSVQLPMNYFGEGLFSNVAASEDQEYTLELKTKNKIEYIKAIYALKKLPGISYISTVYFSYH